MTPQQLGCKVGDVLRSYPADSAYEEPLKMKHLAKPGESITCTVRRYMYRNVARVSYRNASVTSVRFGSPPEDRDLESVVMKNLGGVSKGCYSFSTNRKALDSMQAPDMNALNLNTTASNLTEKERMNRAEKVRINLAKKEPMNLDIAAMGLAAGGKLSKSNQFSVILLLTYHSPRHIQRPVPSHDMEPRRSAYPPRAHPRPSQLRKGNTHRSTASNGGRQSVH